MLIFGFRVKMFKNETFRILKYPSRSFDESSVAEPHNFYAALTPGENFDATPSAPAPTLYSKPKFFKL
jgi:hypothetical protein